MASVTDGSTTIDLGKCDETIMPMLEKTSKRTGGGNIRSITSGERLGFQIKARVTPAVYRTLLDLLQNGASNYYYTPNSTTEFTGLYPSTTFPLNANIYNLSRDWDNRSYFYITFDVESTTYV